MVVEKELVDVVDVTPTITDVEMIVDVVALILVDTSVVSVVVVDVE